MRDKCYTFDSYFCHQHGGDILFILFYYFATKEFEYPRPNDFFEINRKVLELTLDQLKDNIKQLTGEISGRKKAKNPSPVYEAETEI